MHTRTHAHTQTFIGLPLQFLFYSPFFSIFSSTFFVLLFDLFCLFLRSFFNIWITLCCFLTVRSCCCCRCCSCCCCCCRLRVVHRASCLCAFRFILQCLLCFVSFCAFCLLRFFFLLLLLLFLFSVRRFLFAASFRQIFIFRWQRRPRPRIWTSGLQGLTGVRDSGLAAAVQCGTSEERERGTKRERDKYRGRVSKRGR